MPKLALQFLLFWVWLATTTSSFAISVRPQEVQDLHYGEVLFHFYQEDYFTAISHLMVAQQQGQLKHHRDESELLLGGLQLSYGMLDEAEIRFDQLMDQDTDADLRNRAWFYLSKIAYQRDRYEQAFNTVQKVEKPRDKVVRAQLAILDANIRMAMGKNGEAAENLKNAKAPDGWEEYLRINRGIALLRAGEVDKGQAVLDKLGKQNSDTEELRALRDRANLGLGYELLRAGNAAQAREYLNRVRLRGPFREAALLGAGWADAERGDYEQALIPWMALIRLGSYEPPVQEAHLAVPYAFNQLGDLKRSIYFYEQAIDYFDNEQQQIDGAIVTAQSGDLLSLLSQVDTGTSGGWLHENPTLEGVPSGRYLIDVMSGHNFQESLKDYRDLGYLAQLLKQWLDNISLYYDMVDARRLAYEQRAPLIKKQMQQLEPAALQQQWKDYQALIQAEQSNRDPLKLATGKEKQQWNMLQAAQKKLASLPAEPRYLKMRDKAEWLQGILYWQIQSDYETRLWDIEKLLGELEAPIDDAMLKHQQVTAALDNVKAGFDGYDKRIEAMRARIRDLLPRIEAERENTSGKLQQLALKELEIRRQRLVSYKSQARYALARNYDQVARHSEEQP